MIKFLRLWCFGAIMCTSQVVLADINDGLILHFPLDGNANDTSGNNNHGIISGANPAEDRYGNSKGAYFFDGMNDYIYADDFWAPTSAYSVSLWVKSLSVDQQDNSIIGFRTYRRSTTSTVAFAIKQLNADILFWVRDDNRMGEISHIEENVLSDTSTWHRLVITRDDTKLSVYIDNRKVFESIDERLGDTSPDRLVIGATYHDGDDALIKYFNGFIDDVRIYDRSLTNTEVENLFLIESSSNIGRLESPIAGEIMSGIGLIRGWHCNADNITVSIDDGVQYVAAHGNIRGDTQSVCGDRENGFETLWNWNLLGDGLHTIKAFADGAMFGETNFNVVTLGFEEGYVRDLNGTFLLQDFPVEGETTTIDWSEKLQNFVITGTTHPSE